MNEQFLNEDQRDALQEICNVGMGKAAAALAKLLGAFVTLSVPNIRVVGVEQLRVALGAQDDSELRPCARRFNPTYPARRSCWSARTVSANCNN